jgi:hypothetical protein
MSIQVHIWTLLYDLISCLDPIFVLAIHVIQVCFIFYSLREKLALVTGVDRLW